MSWSLKFAVVLGWVLLVAGCQSAPPPQGFERSTRIEVRRVGIAPLGVPAEPQVLIKNPIGAGFGVLGNLIESRRAAGARQEMEAALAKVGYDYDEALTHSISLAMHRAGFAVTVLPGPRPDKERGHFLSSYPSAPKVDAFLDVYAGFVGFQTPQSSEDYRPRLEIFARLISAKDSRTLFQERIVYGSPGSADEDTILVRADDRFRFKNRAALQANPATTARALQGAIEAVAWELAKQFM